MARMRIPTTHGTLSATLSDGTGTTIVLLHGNSVSSRIFAKQFRSPLAKRHRIVAIDLPGHGRSDDAVDPARSYNLPGYADAVLQALDVLGVRQAVLYGWSLGGHVALELASRWHGVIGVAVSGAPPATPTPEGLTVAFRPNPVFPLLGAETLDAAARAGLADALFAGDVPSFVDGEIARTDGRARRMLFEGLFGGNAADERALVEHGRIPVAVLDGEHEPFADPGYLGGLAFGDHPGGGLHQIAGAGHAPFWQSARAFNTALTQFVTTVAPAPEMPAVPFVRRRAAPLPQKAISA